MWLLISEYGVSMQQSYELEATKTVTGNDFEAAMNMSVSAASEIAGIAKAAIEHAIFNSTSGLSRFDFNDLSVSVSSNEATHLYLDSPPTSDDDQSPNANEGLCLPQPLIFFLIRVFHAYPMMRPGMLNRFEI
jgi:hypothetical protein